MRQRSSAAKRRVVRGCSRFWMHRKWVSSWPEDALARGDTATFTDQINRIRVGEGLSEWSAVAGPSARDMLIHERMARLFLRGRRLADMYRFGIQGDEWLATSHAATEPGTLYPIPQSEIEVNCHLNGTCD